jgi:hypothetical protein
MEHLNARARFEYENKDRLSGDLKKASWQIDQTPWSLCPLLPIPDANTASDIHKAGYTGDKVDPEHIEELSRAWVLDSRHKITGFDHQYATFTAGVENFIDSAVYRSSAVSSLHLTYYHVPDVAKHIGRPYSTVSDAPPGALCIIELPTPQHDTAYVTAQITKAKARGHRVAVDLTFLPVATETVIVDLSNVDEVWISANKAWNTGDLRPAWRFSREPVPDALTLVHSRGRYNNASLSALSYMISTYRYDQLVEQHLPTYHHVCKVFDLTPTSNLLAAGRANTTWEPMYTDNWNYNGLIGTHNLIHTHGKYFW